MKIQKLKLTKEQKLKTIEEIQKYFYNERDEEVGELGASLIMDFIIEKIAPIFYNEGIKDSIKFMQEHVDDMYGLEI